MNRLYDITETYIHHQGMRRIKGEGADPLLPLFMLDVVNTIYRSDLLPQDNRREAKKALKDWAKNYHELNADFFRTLNDEQQDRMIDAMDAFESFIGNEVMITRVAVMNLLSDHGIELEAQRILSSVMICNILAQCAQIVWREIYNGKDNIRIQGIMLHSERWMKLYFQNHSRAYVNPNEDKAIEDSVTSLCHKIVKYLQTLS